MFFDKDGNGYIELDELREGLADEYGETDDDVLNDIMREVDTDKVWLSLPVLSNNSIFQNRQLQIMQFWTIQIMLMQIREAWNGTRGYLSPPVS